jgi:hypothetical protein
MKHKRSRIAQTAGWHIVALTVLATTLTSVRPARAADEGIALAIVYDTSGSMAERVPAGAGKTLPKYIIANQALSNIIERLNQYATNAPGGTPRKVEAGLFIFRGDSAGEAVRFGPFDAHALQDWVKNFNKPNGSTPLGNAVNAASRAVLSSGLSRKHVVIITDGMNTVGPKPEAVVPRVKSDAEKKGAAVSFHFVAFEVDAKVFEPVKKLGATVLPASNQQQLNTQLDFIFTKKILLEEEEAPRTNQTNQADKPK